MIEAVPTGALVTGGAGGIGRAIAARLAARGDSVCVADIDEAAAAGVADALVARGLRARAMALDVTRADEVAAHIADLDAEEPLGVVVNNAGIAWSRSIVEVTPEEYDGLMAVNLRGAFFVLQAAARAMISRGRGSIVNISSTSAFTASTSPMVPYDTSKGGLRTMTVSAARELAPHGIRVNAVAPGTIDTDLTRSLLTAPDALERQARERIPAGRIGTPDDVAAAVDFLVSAAAAYITGHVLVVDGGWLA